MAKEKKKKKKFKALVLGAWCLVLAPSPELLPDIPGSKRLIQRTPTPTTSL